MTKIIKMKKRDDIPLQIYKKKNNYISSNLIISYMYVNNKNESSKII